MRRLRIFLRLLPQLIKEGHNAKSRRVFLHLFPVVLALSMPALGAQTIAVSPTSIAANSGNCANYPANQTVTISNSGSGTLATPTIGTVTYGSGATGWLNLWITGSSAPYTLTVEFQGLCGLSNGTYTATIPISSSGASNSPVSIPVTLTIGSGSSPTISLSPTSLTANSGNCTNYPANQTVTISNSGSGALATPTIGTVTYNQGSGWLNLWITGSSAPYTLTAEFQGLCGLSSGTYTAMIPISSSGASNSPVSIPVTLTISSATISLSPTSLAFSATAGGANPAAQNVTVSNSGSGTLASPTTSISYGSGGSGWLTVSCSGSSAPYTCSNQPSISGLSAGTYTATVSVASSGATNTPQTYTVSFTVNSGSTPTISLSPTSITASSGDCTNYPANQTVTISNSGSGTLATPTIGTVTYNQGSGWLNLWITGSSAPYTLTVEFQGLCGLSNGTYTATIPISSSGASNSPVSIPVTLTIGSGSSPSISLSPTSLSFSATAGGANPSAQDVTVSNSGGGTLASPTTSISYGSGGSGWLTVSCSGSSAPYTCINQAATGSLAAGTYNATVSVASSGAGNTPLTYTVSFTVNSGSTPAISLSPSSLAFSATTGGSNPTAQNVTVSNGGSGTLASPTTSITYGSGSGWLSVSCSGSSAPYTCSNQATTGSLAAGTYNATVQVASSGASNTPQSYTVTFTVNSASVCVDSTLANNSNCGPYLYSPIAESSGSNTYVGQDVFNPSSGMTQTIYVTTPGNWYATAQIPYDSGDSVKSYPNVQQLYNGEKLDNFHNFYSSFTESADQSTNTSTDIGYDIFFNGGYNNEVMIQNDLVNRGGQCGPVLATETFGGTNGVPVNTWVLCVYGSETIWQIQQPSSGEQTFGVQSGSVDLLAMLQWLENNTNPNTGATYIPAGSTMYSVSFGFELCYTNNVQENFTVTNFSITQN